jgi:glycosidase
MDRFLFQCNNDEKRLMNAASIQFSVDQPVIIYYGTEQGMTQERSIFSTTSHGDLFARQPMDWNKSNKKLFYYYQNLISTKKMM